MDTALPFLLYFGPWSARLVQWLERYLDTVEAGGSIPPARTIQPATALEDTDSASPELLQPGVHYEGRIARPPCGVSSSRPFRRVRESLDAAFLLGRKVSLACLAR